MSHEIFLAHLSSMQKQLDLLVHPHLSPVTLRQYFVARELELLGLSHSKPLNPAEHSKIKGLTKRLEQNPATPRLWASRALAWQRLNQQDAAMSDFARALQCWSVQADTLSEDQIQQLHSILRTMDGIHKELTQRIINNIPQLHHTALPFLQTLTSDDKT
jgi:hypothetical protein